MDTALSLPLTSTQSSPRELDAPRRNELVLDALKNALAQPGEHRLFQSGKFPGLFPSRTGPSSEAALFAIKLGLFETTRTEAKGRLIVEWVRITPKGVSYAHDRASPKAVLRELREVLGETRAGLPLWMAEMRGEIAGLAAKFELRSRELTQQLDQLSRSVEAAIRRAEVSSTKLSGELVQLVNWGESALEYLDRREKAGANGDCPLRELFEALRETSPGLTVPDFHRGLKHLHENRAVQLVSGFEAPDPEYSLLMGAELCGCARR